MPHYARVISLVVLGLFAIGGAAWRMIKPRVEPLYEETGLLDGAVRARLQAIRDEDKFQPDPTLDPPYPGPRGPKTRARLVAVIDALIADILAEPDGPIEASDLAGRIGLAVAAVAKKAEADARRTHGYLLEVWWIFGFRSAAGYFAPEDGAGAVEGFAEPLPPGWLSPEEPRVPKAAVNPSGAG